MEVQDYFIKSNHLSAEFTEAILCTGPVVPLENVSCNYFDHADNLLIAFRLYLMQLILMG